MLTDRLGLPVSTSSNAARDAYVEGCELLLTIYPGATEAFDRAIAADPGFALAHIGRARARQFDADMAGARASLAAAERLTDGLTERERSHLGVFGLALAGQPDATFAAVCAHLRTWPRDALVLGTTANQTGLIGLSGRAGREEELAVFLGGLADHYGDDPWFNAHYAMALSETSRQAAARPRIERSLALNPRNGGAAHAYAHLCYENGETRTAIDFMHTWLADYPREGGMHGHLNWHLALFELELGNVAEGFRLFDEAFGAADYRGPLFIKLVDSTAFLWRAELAGHPRDVERWRAVHQFALNNFPRSGMVMIDWHVALANAAIGDEATLDTRLRDMEDMLRDDRYPPGPGSPAVARAFAAFQRRDFDAAIAGIEPMLAERERIGGSRAQVDLVEFTLLKAYLDAGRTEDARRFLAARRPGPTRGVPVAGVERVH